jgi:hypothetical protein
MEYTQEIVDEIRDNLTRSMRMMVYRNINKRKSGKALIPYSTVCDVLKTYREGGLPRYRNRRLSVYDEAVRLLSEKGIQIKNK